jgi:hypothetical protein
MKIATLRFVSHVFRHFFWWIAAGIAISAVGDRFAEPVSAVTKVLGLVMASIGGFGMIMDRARRMKKHEREVLNKVR